jgi:hypothetical protein
MEKRDLNTLLEEYIRVYEDSLKEVREDTYRKFHEETKIIIKIIDNWIDIIPKNEEKDDFIHSFQGVLLLYLWKISNWIGYEILNGKYFEAFRDCRFLFEASVLSVIIEDAIESEVYEKWKKLSSSALKCKILQLWEELVDRHAYKRKGKSYKIIEEHVENYLNKLNLSEDERKEFKEVYYSILSDERLGYSIPKMIEELKKFLPIEDKEDILKETWKILNKYTHFTYTFCYTVLERPELLFVEDMDERLFKECFKAYFTTIDLLYCILCWRFEALKERMREIINWWNENFSLRLELTERMIGSGDDEVGDI